MFERWPNKKLIISHMPIPNIFSSEVANAVIHRINKLSPNSTAQWGKMDVAKMLAHCNVTYEMALDNIHPKPGAFQRFILKLFVKKIVVGEKPYPRNSQTAPQFIIKSDKNFEEEKKRLIDYILKSKELGASHFEGKESNSFGALTSTEWNNMFYKHLDHHLIQFGV